MCGFQHIKSSLVVVWWQIYSHSGSLFNSSIRIKGMRTHCWLPTGGEKAHVTQIQEASHIKYSLLLHYNTFCCFESITLILLSLALWGTAGEVDWSGSYFYGLAFFAYSCIRLATCPGSNRYSRPLVTGIGNSDPIQVKQIRRCFEGVLAFWCTLSSDFRLPELNMDWTFKHHLHAIIDKTIGMQDLVVR